MGKLQIAKKVLGLVKSKDFNLARQVEKDAISSFRGMGIGRLLEYDVRELQGAQDAIKTGINRLKKEGRKSPKSWTTLYKNISEARKEIRKMF